MTVKTVSAVKTVKTVTIVNAVKTMNASFRNEIEQTGRNRILFSAFLLLSVHLQQGEKASHVHLYIAKTIKERKKRPGTSKGKIIS